MRRTLLMVVGLMLVAGMAFSQAGSVGVFADQIGNDCNISYAGGLPFNVYCVHVYGRGTAAEFMLRFERASFMWLGDSSPFVSVLGNSQDGVTIAYGVCLDTPVHVLTVSYFSVTAPEACSIVRVVPDSSAAIPGIYVADCEDPPNVLVATGGAAVFNTDTTCDCDIPARVTSWGRIKEMYR